MKMIDDIEYFTLEEIRLELSGIGIKQEHISTLRNLVNTKKIKYVVDGDKKRTSMRYYSVSDKDKILRYFSLTKRRRQLMNLVKVINNEVGELWNVKKSIRIE